MTSAEPFRILCVDDDPYQREALVRGLDRPGWDVTTAADGDAGLARVLAEDPLDVLLTDLRMPGVDGIELARRAREERPELDVILLTGQGAIGDVIEAVRMAVADYIEKPVEIDYLKARLSVLEDRRNLRLENRSLRRTLGERFQPKNLVGNSPAMRKVYDVIERVKDGKATVLIQGESGTGKEVIARAIHVTGSRAEEPFVPVDCGAIAENLIERELFGHVRGAFTGAGSDQPGLMAAAGRGILFLDEVGELPLPMQAKLLRTLQEREFRPLGSNEVQPLRARLIAATNRNLEEEVAEKRFREDLFYRLNVVVIEPPALRQRREDVPLLVRAAVRKFDADEDVTHEVPPETMRILESYAWPGNVRELENCIEQAIALASGPRLTPDHLPARIREKTMRTVEAGESHLDPRSLAAYEVRAILAALDETEGNKRQAAQILGISPTTLYAKIKGYGLEV